LCGRETASGMLESFLVHGNEVVESNVPTSAPAPPRVDEQVSKDGGHSGKRCERPVAVSQVRPVAVSPPWFNKRGPNGRCPDQGRATCSKSALRRISKGAPFLLFGNCSTPRRSTLRPRGNRTLMSTIGYLRNANNTHHPHGPRPHLPQLAPVTKEKISCAGRRPEAQLTGKT
jgi:hypothetical protein